MDFVELLNVSLRGLATGAVYALIGMGFNITFATTSIFNFAHGEFFMIGTMVGVFFAASLGWPLVPALIVTVLVAAIIGIVEERIAVRPAEKYGHSAFGWLLSTLGFSIFLSSGFAIVMGADVRQFPRIFSDRPADLGGVLVVPQQIALIVLALLMGAFLDFFFNRSLYGRAMGAVAQDREAAALRGIPVTTFSMLSFALSAAVAAIAGFFVAPITTAFAAIGSVYLFKGFIACAIGGIPELRGALVGGLLLGMIEAFGAQYIGAGYRDAVTFAVLLAVLAVRPGGLFGTQLARAV